MYALPKDLRFAFRQLKKAPGTAVTVALTLAFGIGATTATFSLLEGVLLCPLPFNDPDRLVLLGDQLEGGFSSTPVTAREIATYSNLTKAFSSLGGFISTSYEVSGGAIPEQVNAARFNAGVFPTLGVAPILGRVFTREEEDAHQQVAVISHALWLSRYHRDPHVVGSPIVLDRRVYTIIGVMPRNFEFPLETGQLDQARLWVPMGLTADELSEEHAGFWGYHMIARMKDGIAPAQAATDADRVAKQIARTLPPSQSTIHIRGEITPLLEYDVAEVRPLLRTLFLAVLSFLLIACINAAGLLLVQAIRRRGDHAVRLALGASSGALLRESLWQGLVLSVAGGLLGLAFAATAIRVALHLLPESMPRVNSISMDARVAAFGLLLALLTGALCSLAPSFAALRTNLIETLKDSVGTGTGASSHTWLRSALVVSEVTMALVLLNTSAAFLRSFQKMRAVNPGFHPDHVLTAGYQLPLMQYETHAKADSFSREVIERLSSKPGVIAVGISNAVPGSLFGQTAYTIEGETAAIWKLRFAMFLSSTGDYFRAMDIPLLDGRYFTAADRSNSPLVMIVSQSMAKRCWPGQRAIGKRLHAGGPQKRLPWATVVGVVADTKFGSRDEAGIDQWYTPAEQPATLYGSDFSGQLSDPVGGYITLRSALAPEQMIPTVRSTFAEVDPLLPVQVQPLNEVISEMEAPRRLNTGLVTGFAVGALLLAVIGIYVVIAFSVSLRTREIAVRMALGSQRSAIAWLVLVSGAQLALMGCFFGVLGSLAVSRIVSSFLFEVSATDPLIYLAGIIIMMAVSIFASSLPATRAASADPITVLRSM